MIKEVIKNEVMNNILSLEKTYGSSENMLKALDCQTITEAEELQKSVIKSNWAWSDINNQGYCRINGQLISRTLLNEEDKKYLFGAWN